MSLWKTLRNTAFATAIIISSGCYALPKQSFDQPKKTIEEITKEERHKEYFDKIKETYVSKKYSHENPPPKDGYSLNYETFIYRCRKNSGKRAREMIFEDLTFNTLQQIYFLSTKQDWDFFVRGGNRSEFGDVLEHEFLKQAQDDAKTPLTRGFTEALREFKVYRNIASTLNDWTFGLFEVRYIGRSKIIPQIPVIDEFQDKIQNPQKYEHENPEDEEWWMEKIKEAKLGVDFTGEITKLSSDTIAKAIPRVYLRWASILRLRLDIESRELQNTLNFNKNNFAVGLNHTFNYETMEQKNVSVGLGYLFDKNSIVRLSTSYDLQKSQEKDFNERIEWGVEFFWRF